MLKIRITKLKDLNPYIWVNKPNMMNVGYNYLWNNGGSSVIGNGSPFTAYRDVFQLSEDGKLDIVGYSRSATIATWYDNIYTNSSKSGVTWTTNTDEIMDVQNGIKHLLNGVTSIGDFCLVYGFGNNKTIAELPDLSNITSVGYHGLNYTFIGCTGLTGTPDLSNITSVGAYGLLSTFDGCTGLTGTPDLSKIASVGTQGLSGTFYGCTGLTGDVYFRSLDPSQVSITGTSISTNPFYQCFYQCTGIDSVHFPASLTDTQKSYLTKAVLFGGTTTTYCKSSLKILFDL